MFKISDLNPCVLALLLAVPAFPCVAQSTPDAGRLLRESERSLPVPLPAKPTVGAARPAANAAAATRTVQVRRFVFEGNLQVSSADLESALQPFTDQRLDFAALQRAAEAATEAYRRAGWLARAVLKAQDITDGEVTITIQEARFGTVRAQLVPGSRVPDGKVMAIFGAHLSAGEPFSLDKLERALWLASELAGVEIRVNLAEGQAAGQTDLLIEMQEGPRATLDPALDNGGSRATGNARISAGLGLANVLGQGEWVRVDTTASQGSCYVRAEASGLLGSRGLRGRVWGSWLDYRLVSPDLEALNGRGTSQGLGAGLGYSLVRSQERQLLAGLTLEHKRFSNDTTAGLVSRYSIRKAGLRLQGDRLDGLLGQNGWSALQLDLQAGTLDLSGSPNEAGDAQTAQTGGSFRLLRYSVTRRQALGPVFTLSASMSGQWADRNLDSAEKFSISGDTAVRAYPNGEGNGAIAHLLSLEVTARLGRNWRTWAFYDQGWVTVNRRNDFTGAPAVNAFSLKGLGLGLGYEHESGLALKLAVARRLGENPNANALTGADQDGTLVKTRVWASAMARF